MEHVDELEPSPLRNVVSGLGAGCGCLGLLGVLLGGGVWLGIPLDLYSDGSGQMVFVGGLVLLVGAVLTMIGLAAFVGSLFMD